MRIDEKDNTIYQRAQAEGALLEAQLTLANLAQSGLWGAEDSERLMDLAADVWDLLNRSKSTSGLVPPGPVESAGSRCPH